MVALEQAVAAPFCSSRLADAGARVIKIERKGETGDFARGYDRFAAGQSSYFVWLNRGKESIQLDLKDAEDMETVHALIAEADVFIQNLAPTATDRLGIGSGELREKHPRLITCDLSGYGSAEELTKRKAYDLLVQAESGLCKVSGIGDEPSRVGVSVCDIACGMYAQAAILEALMVQRDTGIGTRIDVSLFSSIADWMTVPLLHYESDGHGPRAMGTHHPSICPYGSYRTGPESEQVDKQNQRSVLVSIQNEDEFERFCSEVLHKPDLPSDPRFATNIARCEHRDAMDAIVSRVFCSASHDEIVNRLCDSQIAYAEINGVNDLSTHPALRRQPVETTNGNVSLVATPARFDGQHRSMRPVPSLGQHTTAIRAEFSKKRHPRCHQVATFCTHAAIGVDRDDEDASLAEIRRSVRSLCSDFPGSYWRDLDKREEYPTAFVEAVQAAGYLSILIPEQYGGSGLGLRTACAVLEEIHRSGCNAGAAHAQMYTMGSILRAGSDVQKERWLPAVASGELRLQAFGVSEPNNGTDTLALETVAVEADDGSGDWIINGQKMWTSRAEHSDLMLLLARTANLSADAPSTVRPAKALTTFLVDMRGLVGNGIEIKPVKTMMNHSSTTVFFDDVRVPADSVVGGVGNGFSVILDGMNAERVLIASECIGDGRFFIDRATAYAGERRVFGRPIGQNQGVQFPIAQAYAELEAAALMVDRAATLFDAKKPCGTEANMSKHLAAEASWKAGDVCIQTHGGYGFAREYDIERKFRETRLYRVAPISSNLILSYIGEKVLGMPRSY